MLDPILATKPAITFIPEIATRAALARLANIKDLTLTALMNELILKADKAAQAVFAEVGNDADAYLDGQLTSRDYGVACWEYQNLKGRKPQKRRTKFKVVAPDVSPNGTADAPAEAPEQQAEPTTNAA